MFKFLKNYRKRKKQIILSGLKKRLEAIKSFRDEKSYLPAYLICQFIDLEEKIARLESELSLF